MDFDALYAKTPATLDEIRTCVAYALERPDLAPSFRAEIKKLLG